MLPKLIRTSTIPISLNVLLKGQLRFLNKTFQVIGVSGNGKDLLDVKSREGIQTEVVEMKRNISPFHDIVSLFKLYILFKKEKPIIVHSITPKAGLLSMLAAKAAGVPVRMHTFTGLIFPTQTGILKQILIKTDQLLCWAATHVYPEGNGVRNDLLAYAITSKPLKVLANGNVNGVDLDYYTISQVSNEQKTSIKESLQIEPDDFVFVFVGRLVADKGINELIAAFKRLDELVNKNNNSATCDKTLKIDFKNSEKIKPGSVKLLLVGAFEHELDPLQKDTLLEINTNKNIISVGFQSDVRSYLALSDVFVFPSYREGFPNVVLQAGAMELPCIVTNINGSNEIIEDQFNGFIIEAKNQKVLFEIMSDIINNQSQLQPMKFNARKQIEEKFEQSIVWKALLAEYNNVLTFQF